MAKIATITLNTAYDLVGRIKQIELGEVNTVETLGLFPAGKGINVAKVLHDLGINVAVSGFLGEDNQGEFNQMFQALKLEDKFQRIPGKTRINVKITETEGDVTDLNFLGYHITEKDWCKFVQNSLSWSQHFDIIAVCGSLPQGISSKQFAIWLSQLTRKGAKVVLDSSQAALASGLQANLWLTKPNHRELEAWVGRSLHSLAEIVAAGKQLKAQGIANVIISMGEKGSIWLNNDRIIQAIPPKCENIVSTVGAGDSMVAGLIYGMNQNWDQTQTLAFASAVSAFTVSQNNVGINDRTLLNAILQQVKINVLEG